MADGVADLEPGAGVADGEEAVDGGLEDFKNDMKSYYEVAGVMQKHLTFIFGDNQIVDEGFLEAINSSTPAYSRSGPAKMWQEFAV